MINPMTLNRFQELADAYGGVVARWPELERDGALRMASHSAAVAILAQALVLDEALDAWVLSAPMGALRERVLADAPAPVRRIVDRARVWWSGVGIAAALAGVAAGTVAVAMAPLVDASIGGSTSFGDVGTQEADR